MPDDTTSQTTQAASGGPPAPDGAAPRRLRWGALRDRLDEADLLTDVVRGPDAPDTFDLPALADDSRAVTPGGAFVALRGVAADGHSFIDNAIQNGARLVVCEATPPDAKTRFPATVFARVRDTRAACAETAAAYYGDPADALRLVGVTGTNGKTTVAVLVQHLLSATGTPTGLLSTTEVRMGDTTTQTDRTTPGPLVLHRLLRRMVEGGCTACALEVSSHALDQRRVHGLDFEAAVFTNLTTDHLNYHGTRAAYRRAKKRLFDGLPAAATALYNADDPAGAGMMADTAATPVSYAVEGEANITATIRERRLDGLRLTIDGRECHAQLAGAFNAYNLAAAYGVGRALDQSADRAVEALAAAPPVPGRLERVPLDSGPTVLVDYAHTPDALDTVLQTVRDTMPDAATLWCVFGCGGDRDAGKRPEMGGIAERRADRVIVTSDNPRTEAPEAILNDIRAGLEHPDKARWEVDREAAIRTAAEHAAPSDVVVIAGKGHETTQTIGTETRPFDDRTIARKHFR